MPDVSGVLGRNVQEDGRLHLSACLLASPKVLIPYIVGPDAFGRQLAKFGAPKRPNMGSAVLQIGLPANVGQ